MLSVVPSSEKSDGGKKIENTKPNTQVSADQDLLQTIHRAAGEKATYLCISSRKFKF